MDAAEISELAEHKDKVGRAFKATIVCNLGATSKHVNHAFILHGEPEESELIAHILSLASDDISRVSMICDIQVVKACRGWQFINTPQESDIPPYLLGWDGVYNFAKPGPYVHFPKEGFYWGGFRDGVVAATKATAAAKADAAAKAAAAAAKADTATKASS